MSHYADYLTERTTDLIMEDDCGFAVYRYLDGGVCYIVDIYVAPLYRKENRATILANAIVALAKEKGCTELLGSVQPSAIGSTTSLKVLLGYGMTLKSAGPDFIVFRKDI